MKLKITPDIKAVGIFLGAVAVIAILITLFSWAKPMSINDEDDVKDVVELLQEDNSTIEVISIGDLATYKDTEYQLVKYNVTKDSVTTEKTAMIEVEKHFLNYQGKKVLLP